MTTRLLINHALLFVFFSFSIQSISYAQCASPTDCDGDGVLNSDDLDDDNDGILDSNEGYTPPTLVTLDPVHFNPSMNGVNNSVSGNLVTINRNCLSDLSVDFAFVSTGGDIPNLTSENGNTRLRISYDPNLSGTSRMTYTFSEPVDVIISLRRNKLNEAVTFHTPYDNIYPGANSTIVSATYPVIWHNDNDGNNTHFEFLDVSTITLGLRGDGLTQFQTMELNYLDNATCLDTDMDGLSDHQDTDSDGDGCPDTIEAGNSDPEQDGILGTTPTIVDPTSGIVTGTAAVGYNGNSPAVLDENTNICSIILPVEMTGFQIDCQEATQRASWRTVSELDNSHFDLQGTSELSETTHWETIATVDGVGKSTTEQNYSIDFSSREYSYFRLKQVDFSGKEQFSDLIYANCFEDDKFFTVYVGTDNSGQFILINGQNNGPVEITDFSGRTLYKQSGESNDQPIRINVSGFSSGIYIVRVGDQSQLFRK